MTLKLGIVNLLKTKLMKKTVFLLVFVLNSFIIQAQWNEVIPHPNLINSWSIFFINDSTGFIGGATYDTIAGNIYHNSRILKTSDWGLTWNDVFHASLDSNASGNLDPRGIYFTTPLKGYIVGGNYKILRTFDSGNTWQVQTVSAGMSYSRTILFTDTLTGYAANQWELYKTSDGGDTWELDTNQSGGTLDLSFPSKLVGYGTWAKTQNGAQTWESYFNPGFSINAIDCFNDSTCITVGLGANGNPNFNFGVIARTNNSAQTWTANMFNQELGTFRDIQFVNDSAGFLIGGGGPTFNDMPFWKTIDQGHQFYRQQVNHSGTYPGSPYCLHCPSEQVCYVGCYGSNKVYRTTNGGGPLIGLGIGDHISQNNEFSIYPNPTNDLLNINYTVEHNKQYNLSIINILGIEVYNQHLNANKGLNKIYIDTKLFAAGSYIIRLGTDNKFEHKIFIKN